jgi:hypothetical protein
MKAVAFFRIMRLSCIICIYFLASELNLSGLTNLINLGDQTFDLNEHVVP